MTISRTVYNQLFEHRDASSPTEHVIRLRPTEAKAGAVVMSAKNKIQMWTQEEHERFLQALEMFPAGPWKKVADFIGTKTPRQTMTHAQKYRQKISRRQRGLRNQKKSASATSSAPSSPKRSVDPHAEFSKSAPQPAQSPYGVADVYVKREEGGKAYPMHGVAATYAAAVSDPSIGRLDMLARAMQMQTEAKPSAFAYPSPPRAYPSPPSSVAPSSVSSAGASVLAAASAESAGGFGLPLVSASSPSSSSLPPLSQILNLRGASSAAQPRAGCSCSCSCSPSGGAQAGCHRSPARQ